MTLDCTAPGRLLRGRVAERVPARLIATTSPAHTETLSLWQTADGYVVALEVVGRAQPDYRVEYETLAEAQRDYDELPARMRAPRGAW